MKLLAMGCANGDARIHRTWEGERRWEGVARLILGQHRVCVCLSFGSVGRCDGIDDGLSLFVANFCRRKLDGLVMWKIVG